MSVLERLQTGITTKSPEETTQLAQSLAPEIPENSTIALHGDLGVGKTTFVRGLALGWGINKSILSPTFNIFLTYKGTRNLLHLDAYRLENAQQVESLMLEEFMKPPFTMVVEWPDNIKEYLPKNTIHIRLWIDMNKQHHIEIKKKWSI